MIMGIDEILTYLPHRYPFLMLDRVTEAEPGKVIQGYKLISANEPFFQGHFPARPIMPGVLMIEGMAQIAGILIYLTSNVTPGPEPKFVLAGVERARFKKVVIPGDKLEYEAVLVKGKRGLWKFDCTASVLGKVVASATILNAEIGE